ncbi:unnamed protein product [Ceratitis capitata]|uniref:(Mediterranean fruit fly) hypothetical protein n=1 Tax=Ceratitis capitata TaxID=7213 RepID=A0A811VGH7_CERCA|nr:unnamed protein product [Ceratitis capitata]
MQPEYAGAQARTKKQIGKWHFAKIAIRETQREREKERGGGVLVVVIVIVIATTLSMRCWHCATHKYNQAEKRLSQKSMSGQQQQQIQQHTLVKMDS